MSELKAGVIKTSYGEGFCFVVNDVYYDCDEYETKFYLKSEVDKVIAEKDREIAELERKVDMNKRARQYWRKEWILECKDNCRHKYKLCMAMAKWCDERIVRIEKDYAFWKYGKDYAQNFYKKWHNRWLKLAEKFKPNKEAK